MISLPKYEKSLWRDDAPMDSLYSPLKEDLNVDVCIVGAGITGLTSAYLLKQAGFTVAVLEKRTVGAGTTGRTTGKVSSQHETAYHEMIKNQGLENAQVYADANQKAIERVKQIIKKERIDCDWEVDDNYVYTTSSKNLETIQQEAEATASLGLPSTFTTSTPLPFKILGAVKFTKQGKINAQKYVQGLAKAVHGNGSYIYENTKATGFSDAEPCVVRTKEASVMARDVIVATNVPTMPLMARGGYCVLEYPTESYIVAAELNIEQKGMFISPDDDNYSILPIQVDDKAMILIGGCAHISGVRLSTEKRFKKLAEYAHENFDIREVTHKWSDRDYIAYDGLPIVGKAYPWSKNLYVATAFRKWGLSNGTAAAMILTDLISGAENPWAKAFNPQRGGPIKSIPRVALKYLTRQN